MNNHSSTTPLFYRWTYLPTNTSGVKEFPTVTSELGPRPVLVTIRNIDELVAKWNRGLPSTWQYEVVSNHVTEVQP